MKKVTFDVTLKVEAEFMIPGDIPKEQWLDYAETHGWFNAVCKGVDLGNWFVLEVSEGKE